jgi:sugar O-acyltransferase (sialic acid O-acetyltransferase NeuD family)
MKPLFAVYGASGFGREVIPLAREQIRLEGFSVENLVFIDDNPVVKVINGQRVLSYSDFLSASATSRTVALAIYDGFIRERLASRLLTDGVQPWTIRAANVIAMDSMEMGEGGILCPFVTITSNIRIGRYFHANIYSYVAHDCIIGDFVTFAPAVKCNGNVIVEDHVYIGTGALIKQGEPDRPMVIGRGAVIGMGAVVTKDVSPGSVVVGNPARPMPRSKTC